MLDDYAGTLILVSHDRDFLDRVVGSVLVSEGEGAWIEYAGGYTDMIAQRGEGVQARTVASTTRAGRAEQRERGKAQEAAKADAAPPKGKLNFKDQHELKTLPERIKKLESDIGKLRAVLADPQLYARDPARFSKASGLLGEAETQLGQAEDRWLELEMLRDA